MISCYVAFLRIVLQFLCFHPSALTRQKHKNIKGKETRHGDMPTVRFC